VLFTSRSNSTLSRFTNDFHAGLSKIGPPYEGVNAKVDGILWASEETLTAPTFSIPIKAGISNKEETKDSDLMVKRDDDADPRERTRPTSGAAMTNQIGTLKSFIGQQLLKDQFVRSRRRDTSISIPDHDRAQELLIGGGSDVSYAIIQTSVDYEPPAA